MSICDKRVENIEGKCRHYVDPKTPGTKNVCGYCTLQDEFHCIDELSAFIPRMSHTAVLDWLKCRRLYYWKYIKGVKRRDAVMGNPLKMGALWDLIQDGYYGGVQINDRAKKLIDRYEIGAVECAKVRALNKAYKELGLQGEQGGIVQEKFEMINTCDKVYSWNEMGQFNYVITGKIDRGYEDYFVENKLSGKPEMYLDPYFLLPQLGTYFMAKPNAAYCLMEVVRTPGLYLGANEDVLVYEKRTYEDIMKRPSFYFMGYNKLTGKYGRKFYRPEFNYDELKKRYDQIGYEIMDAIERDAFYQNSTMCNFPWECDLIDVCRGEVLSEKLYERRPLPTDVAEQVAADLTTAKQTNLI